MADTNRHRYPLIRLLGLGVMLLPLVAILLENGRSRRTWEEYKKEWEAKGDRFDRAAFLPPEVSEEENFAATPLLAPLLAWHFDTTNWCMAYEDPDAARRAQGLFVWLEDVVQRRTKFQGAEFARIGVVEDRFRRFPDAAPMEVRMMLENSGTNTAAGLLKVFEFHDTAMAELDLASRRPSMVVWRGLNPARFPESSSLWGTVRRVGAAFRARALARLRTGDVDGALADIRAGLNVSGQFRSEPSMLGGLVRNALLRLTIEPVWEGLARHQWQEDQLTEIGSWLGAIDLITESARCLRAERADWLDLLDALIRSPEDCFSMQFGEDHDFSSWRWTPDAVFRHNQLALARLYQTTFLPPLDTGRGVLDLAAVRARAKTNPDSIGAHETF